ncbi:YhcN/YlaJ family sporulation lipoprotein [Oceanobacillus halotolerans]|uniref:YhcN/YlaJ family sporulation lipoprotein n=1 Tax=Oceanobacillus halotolerans TaxID=2663380 RepID=UPI001CF773C5|nr:YhcN/YlaJ family sporulation lipoprotein [Oceanobacillus halotolerans]
MPLKIIYGLLTISLLSLTACGGTNNANEDPADVGDNLGSNQDYTNQNTTSNEELHDKIGYVQYTREELENDQEQNREITMDRNAMANIITRNVLRSDGFDEVATLVTDEEVLIAYRKDDEADAENVADIAKKTAMSMMPRYFEIYVSDNETLMKDIHSLHNSSLEDPDDYENTINSIIDEMKESPQGKENRD